MKYIASWSGGKDSTASIILAHEHNEPLDLIIFSEVMFDENISGELPEHIDFIKNKAIPVFESWGYAVNILHAKLNYMDIFMREPTRGKHFGTGKKTGFPMSGRCQINKSVKILPIKSFLNSVGEEFMQYIGIAVDEPVRMERIVNAGNKISLLEKYSYTEQMAFDLCKKYDLLSPIYEFAPRGGCLNVYSQGYEDGTDNFYNATVEIIRKHMNDGWIPVEKALPEYGKKVLAYGKSGEIDIASLYSRDKHMWLVGSMCSVAFDIIAWRTLPAPYRPERRDNYDGE